MSADVLEEAFASTSRVLGQVGASQLDQDTPCASWKVRDLLGHIVGATTFFAVVAETGEVPVDPVPPQISVDTLQADFDAGAARAVKAFRAEGAMEKTMKLPFGELPGSVFVWIAATDTFTHGWDLATATGQSRELDPKLAEQLLANARHFLPDALRGPDRKAPFGPQVEVSDDAPAADRLAGFLGRQP
jgi:uncharacterized protein (TIGR03086 family)